jgi:hypothetical protein
MGLRERDLDEAAAGSENARDTLRQPRRRLARLVRRRPFIGTPVGYDSVERSLIDHNVEAGLGERGAQVEHVRDEVRHGRRERRVLRAHVRDAGLAVVAAHDVREPELVVQVRAEVARPAAHQQYARVAIRGQQFLQ